MSCGQWVCMDCLTPIEDHLARCSTCDAIYRRKPRPCDLACALCGDRVRRGPGSLPQGRAMCRPCRRWISSLGGGLGPLRNLVKPPQAGRRLVCPTCSTEFVDEMGRLTYCSPGCCPSASRRVGDLSGVALERQRAKEARRKKPRANESPGTTAGWQKIRLVVLAGHPPCGICGLEIDYSLKYPDRFSASVDHIVSWKAGGAWFDLANLQAAHFACNAGKQPVLR